MISPLQSPSICFCRLHQPQGHIFEISVANSCTLVLDKSQNTACFRESVLLEPIKNFFKLQSQSQAEQQIHGSQVISNTIMVQIQKFEKLNFTAIFKGL